MIQCFDALLAAAAGRRVPVALAAADSASALAAVVSAADRGIAVPLLVGDEARIRAVAGRLGLTLRAEWLVPVPAPDAAAARAVELVRSGDAAVLLKGSLRTDELLRAVLSRDAGLRTGQLLSDVLLYEQPAGGFGDAGPRVARRLIGVTDGGITPDPDEDALKAIVANGVAVFRALGHARPRVALLSATENVSEALPSTVRARAVAEWAADALPGCDVAGPLALDNALLAAAAEAKGISGPVAGRADILVAPGIEAGNILGKATKYLAGSITAHVVVGAAAPVLIPSRVESAADKLHSIALGALLAGATWKPESGDRFGDGGR